MDNERLNSPSIPQAETPSFPPNIIKPLFDLTKRDIAFAICALMISIFTAVFGFCGGFALGYGISILFVALLFIVYFAKGAKLRALPVICGLLAFGMSPVFIATTNGSVRFFAAVGAFLLGLVCFDGMVRGDVKGNRQTLGIFYSAFSSAEHIGPAIRSLFSDKNGRKRAIGKALIGFLCAVPVLLVVVPLLLSSDDAFQGMMTNIFSNTGSTIFQVILGILLSLVVIPYGFSLKYDRTAKIKPGKFAGIENIYIISFLSAIGVCYVLYLFSQLAYFFSAFRGFLPNGEISYAQYARKGFFEMCAIAVINLLIVFSALLLARKQNSKVCHGIQAVATFIAGFTLMIIATAISKMVLYIGVYGMTVLRLTTSTFMVFLSVVFVSVILRIYCAKINILKTALVTAGCILLVLGIGNVNKVCAAYNYESYLSGRLDSVDVQAIYDLGDEGIPYIVKLTRCSDPKVVKEAEKCLAQAYLRDYFDNMRHKKAFTLDELKQNQKDVGFARYSIPKARAYDSLYDYLQKNPGFSDRCQKLLY